MKFYSTNNHQYRVTLEEAVRKGLPDDKGLFMPGKMPLLPTEFFEQLSTMSLAEIGYNILRPYLQDEVPDNILQGICEDAFSFPVPLVRVKDNIYTLELYHGPTLAFKDFGARFMARLIGYFNISSTTKNTILVATSGDTGSAVASGFYQVENVEVVILYPRGKVSDLQERQMTTLGSNIHALAIEGNFDDCQRLVKTAFVDKNLSAEFGLTSANSINLARLLPQMIYYFYAYGQIINKDKPIVFSVPSGNYGNLTAGLIANKMGLPVSRFIAAANANNIVPGYLQTGVFEPKPSIKTISNAMDVGDPSNFVRLQDILNHSWDEFKVKMQGYSYSDDQTRETISKVYNNLGYLLDPHGAIGYKALNKYLKSHAATGIFLETAHPIKFKESIEPLLGHQLAIPEQLSPILNRQKISQPCSTDFHDFKVKLKNILA